MPDVVALAQFNAERNKLNVKFLQSRWFENITGKFDLIVSNPPYIDAQDEHLRQGDVRFEPLSALVANDTGYADLRHIIELAPSYLNSNGVLLLEHGWQQGEKVRSKNEFFYKMNRICKVNENSQLGNECLLCQNSALF